MSKEVPGEEPLPSRESEQFRAQGPNEEPELHPPQISQARIHQEPARISDLGLPRHVTAPLERRGILYVHVLNFYLGLGDLHIPYLGPKRKQLLLEALERYRLNQSMDSQAH